MQFPETPAANWHNPTAWVAVARGPFLLLLILMAVAGNGRAQTPPTPGGVLETVPGRGPELPPTPPAVLFPNREQPHQISRNAPRFTVNSFHIVGNTVFSEARLKRVVEGYLDLQLNLYDLHEAADDITRYYHAHGYTLARAVIPAQKVERGIVRIEVVEGRLGKISVEGNKRYSKQFIEARAASLPRNGLVTQKALERSLLLMNDLPGLTARATLQPGAAFGTTDMVIKTQEKMFAGSVAFNNYGREEVGQDRVDAHLDVNNPLGIGDQISVRAIQSQNNLLTYGQIGYSLPLMANGTRLGLSYSDVTYDIAGQFSALGLDGEVTTAQAVLSYPYLRSRRSNILLSAGGRHTATEQHAFGVPISSDQLNVGTVSLLGNWIHSDSSMTNATILFTSNFENNQCRCRQDAEFGKWDISINHLRAATKNWDLYLSGEFVYSRDALPDTEKFSIGGPGSVRGYQPAELRGDDGWQGTAELRRQFEAINMIGVFSMFYDAGAVENKGFSGTDSIRSVGLGVTLFPNRHLQARVEVAHPLSARDATDGKSDRLWFVLSGTF
ncbi:MAG TPA: ShlB/FhaC/HecB family hemolysin secretion/activation protein [Burkholderiales bacterium]|nr:ShlB/FhaC/HecB family hemolysin secretion/activation protein [Burkholderiales bacterium]